MNRSWQIVVAVLAMLLVTGVCLGMKTNVVELSTNDVQTLPPSARPQVWASKLTIPGITNCYRITTNLYRGAQPTVEGMARLKAMGIKTVINLRSFHSDKNLVAGTGLKSVRFEVKPWHGEEEDVVRFLKVVSDTNNLPAFVHCQRGADRTGMMCAMYRIVICGWTKPEAIREMTQGGFHFSPVWENLVDLIEKTDVDRLRMKIGMGTNSVL